MYFDTCLKLLLLSSVALSVKSVPLKGNLVQFYPISRDQYESVLRMTGGQPVISEGRLISGGFRTFNDLRTTISNDITSGVNQILSFAGLRSTNRKTSDERLGSYPLCVIKTNNEDGDDTDEDSHENKTEAEYDTELSQTRARDEEETETGNRPIVSCIVVVKSKDEPMKTESAVEKKQVPTTSTQRRHTIAPPPHYFPPRYYDPFAGYPYYPFYDYPYYPVARGSSADIAAQPMARNAPKSKISNNKSTGRSGDGGYPGYPGYAGYTGYYPYGAGYQQSQQYGPYYGGCNSYGNIYGNNGFNDGDESGEDDDDSSAEVAGEIGGENF